MSRMPPIPAANQSPYGPGAAGRDAVADRAPHTDLPFGRHPQDAQEQQRGPGGAPAREAVVATGGAASAQVRGSDTLMLVIFGALVAAITWVAGRQRRHAG